MPDVLDDPEVTDSAATDPDAIDWEQEAKQAGVAVAPTPPPPKQIDDWEAEAKSAGVSVIPTPKRQAPQPDIDWEAEARKEGVAIQDQVYAGPQLGFQTPPQPGFPRLFGQSAKPAVPPPVAAPQQPTVYGGPQLGQITPPPAPAQITPTPLEPGLQRQAPAPPLPTSAGGIAQSISNVMGESPRTDVQLARAQGLVRGAGQFIEPPAKDAPSSEQIVYAIRQMALNQVSPQEVGKMLAFGLGGKGVALLQKGLANSQWLGPVLQAIPGLDKAFDFVSRAAIPGYILGSGGETVYEQAQIAEAAKQRGDTAAEVQARTQEVISGLMTLAGAYGVNQAWQVQSAYPPAVTPAEKAAAEQVGGIATPGRGSRSAGGERVSSEAAGAIAERLRQQGAPLAARAWENLDRSQPIVLNIGGRRALLMDDWSGGRPGVGRLNQFVFDENGNLLTGGDPDAVKGWIDQQSTSVLRGRRSGVAAAGIPGATYEPLDEGSVLTGARQGPASGAPIPPQVGSQVAGGGAPSGPSAPNVPGASVIPPSVGVPPMDPELRDQLHAMSVEEIAGKYGIADINMMLRMLGGPLTGDRMSRATAIKDAITRQQEGAAVAPEQAEGAVAPQAPSVVPPPVGTIGPDGQNIPVEPEGEGGEGSAPSAPNPPVPGVPSGQSATTLLIPGTRIRLQGQYRVRPLSELTSSHHGFSFQPNPDYRYVNERDYTKQEPQARVMEQAHEFEPRYLINNNPDNVNGPPIVDPKGHAFGGNSRLMTIQRVYSMYPEHAQAYKDHLEQQASLYGIDPAEVRDMHQPVLVREIDPPPADAARIISLLNKTGTAALSPGERAISDSQRVSPETLERMQYEIEKLGEDGTLNKALAGDGGPAILERLVQDGLITERESPEYLGKDNKLTPEAKTRIGRLMIGRFFDNVLQYEETPQGFRNKLEKVVGPLASLEGRPEWDHFNQPIREAIRIIHEAQARGISKFEDLNAQQGLYGETKYSPEAMAWAYALKNNSGKALGAAFRRFSELEGASRPGAPQDMFGPEPVSLQEAYAEAIAPLKASKGTTIGKAVPELGNQAAPGELQSRRAGDQQSFFSPEDEAASQALETSRQNKLLGERLTAQLHSGQAARPANLKPAEQRNMFEEEGPEQGGLDLSEAVPGEGEGEMQALRRVAPDQLPVKRNLKAVQQMLHDRTQRRAIKESAPDAVKLHRLVNESRKNLEAQLDRHANGMNWYEDDTELSDQDIAQAFAELARNPRKLFIFKMISAAVSPGLNPKQEADQAAHIYAIYRKTGTLPVVRPGGKPWSGRGVRVALRKLNRLAELMGEDGLAHFLTGIQDAKTIRQVGAGLGIKDATVNKWIGGRERMLGAAVLGPKVGRYFTGIAGLPEDGTAIDLWMARMHYRQWGRLIGTNGKAASMPRTPADQKLMMRAHEVLAREFGLTPKQVQSLLWHYEQELYRSLGATARSYRRSEGTLKYLEDNGLAKAYIRDRRSTGTGERAALGAPGSEGGRAEPDLARAVPGSAEAAGREEGEEEIAARNYRKPRAGSGQLSLPFGEDSLTREQVDQAVQNPRPHIVSVDPSQYPRLPNPAIRDTSGTFQDYVKNYSLFRPAPSIGNVPVILVNDAGMDVLLIAKGTWHGMTNNGRTTVGMAVRSHEWKAVLDAEIGAVRRQNSARPFNLTVTLSPAARKALGMPLPLDERTIALASVIRKALGMPTLAQQIQDAGGPTAPGAMRKVQGEWDRPVYSRQQIIVANAGDDRTDAQLKSAIEEEYDHIQHMRLPGGFQTLPFDITETDPLARKAADYLHQTGYPKLLAATNPNRATINALITSEILVRLMRGGRYPGLGLTAQEASDLGGRYMAELEAKHGEHAAVIIEQIRRYALTQPADTFFARRREPGIRQPAEAGEIAARGPPGIQAGDGETVSGLQDQGPEFQALAPIRKAAERAAILAKGTKAGRALGIGPTIERQVIPHIDNLEKAIDQILSTFSPASRGPYAEKAALSTRADAAHMDRVVKQASTALEELRKPLGKLSQNQRWKFIIRSESNKPQTDATLPNGEVIPAAEMNRIAGVFKQVNDKIRAEVEDADGPATKRIWREVFWPNFWKETSTVRPGTPGMPTGLGKSPLAGPRGFEKKKVFDTFLDGVRQGYTPLFDNPVDYWQAKTREMAKFAMFTRLKTDILPLAKFKAFTDKMPPGYDKVNDPFARVLQYSKTEKGFVARGDWVYPKEAARIINNYLSPDPRQTMPVWKLITDLGNWWLRWKLSGFYHFGATALNGIYSHAALGARMAAAGDMKGAAKQLMQAPVSPLTDPVRGGRLKRQFLDINGTQTAAFQALEEGGFRAGQDPFFQSNMRQRVKEAWREGERITPILASPFAAIEWITVPLMEHYVPAMKMAAAHDLARFELEQYQKRNGGMMPNPPRMRKIMADAVDSIDNRFGQLTYSNIFWNAMLKAALMSVIMSVGWNLGTVRELGGAILKDIPKAITKGGGLTNRIAYLAALIAIHTMGAVLYQKLATGKNPSSAKDVVYPQDGGVDERGHPTRVSFPDYMKELWNWTNDPAGSAINKTHPMLSFLLKYIQNRDYWGSKIRNPEDDWRDQLKQFGSYVAREEGLPLSGSNISKMKERSGQSWGDFLKENPGKVAMSQVGFSPTPAWIGLTPAEKLLAGYQRDRQPVGGRDVEEAQRSTARAAIVRAIRLGQDSQPAVENALRQGLITGKDLAKLHKAAAVTPLQAGLNHDMLNPGEVLRIWEAADPDERKQIEGLVKLRLARMAHKPQSHWSDWAREAAQKQFGIQARPRLAIPPGYGVLPPAVGAGQ